MRFHWCPVSISFFKSNFLLYFHLWFQLNISVTVLLHNIFYCDTLVQHMDRTGTDHDIDIWSPTSYKRSYWKYWIKEKKLKDSLRNKPHHKCKYTVYKNELHFVLLKHNFYWWIRMFIDLKLVYSLILLFSLYTNMSEILLWWSPSLSHCIHMDGTVLFHE